MSAYHTNANLASIRRTLAITALATVAVMTSAQSPVACINSGSSSPAVTFSSPNMTPLLCFQNCPSSPYILLSPSPQNKQNIQCSCAPQLPASGNSNPNCNTQCPGSSNSNITCGAIGSNSDHLWSAYNTTTMNGSTTATTATGAAVTVGSNSVSVTESAALSSEAVPHNLNVGGMDNNNPAATPTMQNTTTAGAQGDAGSITITVPKELTSPAVLGSIGAALVVVVGLIVFCICRRRRKAAISDVARMVAEEEGKRPESWTGTKKYEAVSARSRQNSIASQASVESQEAKDVLVQVFPSVVVRDTDDEIFSVTDEPREYVRTFERKHSKVKYVAEQLERGLEVDGIERASSMGRIVSDRGGRDLSPHSVRSLDRHLSEKSIPFASGNGKVPRRNGSSSITSRTTSIERSVSKNSVVGRSGRGLDVFKREESFSKTGPGSSLGRAPTLGAMGPSIVMTSIQDEDGPKQDFFPPRNQVAASKTQPVKGSSLKPPSSKPWREKVKKMERNMNDRISMQSSTSSSLDSIYIKKERKSTAAKSTSSNGSRAPSSIFMNVLAYNMKQNAEMDEEDEVVQDS